MNDKLIKQLQEEDLFPQADKKEIQRRAESIDWSREFPCLHTFITTEFGNVSREDFNKTVRSVMKAGMATSRESLQAMEETLYHLVRMFDETLSGVGYPAEEA